MEKEDVAISREFCVSGLWTQLESTTAGLWRSPVSAGEPWRSSRLRSFISRCFDSGPAFLFGRGPIAWKIVRFGDAGKFFVVTIPAAELFHAILYRIGLNRITSIGRHFTLSPTASFVLLFADQLAGIFVNVFPTKHFLCHDSVQIPCDFA